MRIGYLVPEFPGQTHAFFWREVRALREAGYHVTLLSTQAPREPCAHSFAAEAQAETTYLFPPQPSTLGAAARARLHLPAAFRYLNEIPKKRGRDWLRAGGLLASAVELLARSNSAGFSHVHAHSCANAAHVVALARLLGGPSYSLTLHGDLKVYGDGHALKFRDATFVSVVTHALQEQVVRETGIEISRAPVIRMGVDTDLLCPKAWNEQEEAETKPFRAVTVARLNRTKGHVYAVKAIARLRDQGLPIRYEIAGTGPEQAAIEEEISRLGLEDQVRLLGGLAEHEVARLLSSADAFLLTSYGLGEAAPVSVMEAMATGLPVICSRIGGTAEMIDDQQNGFLVDQKQPEQIAEALALLVNDRDLRRRIGEEARQRAQREFDFRTNALRLMKRIEASAE